MRSIASLQNPAIKHAASLHQKKYRDEEGLFLVEGQEMIGMALTKKWRLHSLFLNEAKPELQILYMGHAEQAILVSQEILAKISKKENPQHVIAVFHKRLEDHLPATLAQMIVPAMEHIRDPGNLGTVMRVCHALGLTHLVLVGNCCDPFAPETIRASMGSFAAVHVVAMADDAFAAWMKDDMDYSKIATDVVDATDYREVNYKKSVLLMGNEQKGVSETLKKQCDQFVHIPMPGGTESLNVAMATSLLLYEAMRPNL